MKTFHWTLFLVMSLGLTSLSFGQKGLAPIARSCGTVNGSADLKEGGGHGQKAQYWINGFPGKDASCKYTLELCFNGSGKEIGAKTYMTTATGNKMQSADNLVNCNNGWSKFFDGAVAGAQDILLATEGGVSITVRFTGK